MIIVLMLSKTLAANEKIVLGLSQDEVAITANFDGSQILLFGAIQREVRSQLVLVFEANHQFYG